MRRAVAVLAGLLGACGPQTAGPAPPPDPPPPSDAAAQAQEGWATYSDPLGFTVRYPPSLVILPETGPRPDRRPPLVHRVRFLDRELAAGETANLELPQFSVEVFTAPPGPLRPWLEENGRIPPGAGVQSLEMPGAREALHIRDPHLLAPNEFFWLATARHAFLIVPLGLEGEAMQKTFRLTGQ